MGSWFSSSAGYVTLSKEEAASCREFMEEMDRLDAQETDIASDDADCIRDLAYEALRHYNSNHAGADFRFLNQRTTYFVYPPTKDMKAACVGFRRDLWYHVNFSARHRTDDDADERTFFAELRYDRGSHDLIVETCTIIEKPPFISSCAMCPDESHILHPAKFVCGKEGHGSEFFHERCAWDGQTKVIFKQSEMLSTPFLLGEKVPRYRLVD